MFHCTNVDLRIFTIVCSANPCKIHMQTWWQHFGPYLYSTAFIVDGKSGIINHARDISGFEVTVQATKKSTIWEQKIQADNLRLAAKKPRTSIFPLFFAI